MTIDGCASRGTVLQDHRKAGSVLPFISRYKEYGCEWVNFLSYPLERSMHSVMWLFPPRKILSGVVDRVLRSAHHGKILFLLMWHAETPVYYNVLKARSEKNIIYRGDGLFLRPNKSKTSFCPFSGPSAVVFLLSTH